MFGGFIELAQEELQKSQKRHKKHYIMIRKKPRRLEGGDQVLILLRTGEVTDLEVKLGEDLSEDQQYTCILKVLIWRHPDVFTYMPEETDVIHSGTER